RTASRTIAPELLLLSRSLVTPDLDDLLPASTRLTAAGWSATLYRTGFQRSIASPRAHCVRASAASRISLCGSTIRIGKRIFGWNLSNEVSLVSRFGAFSRLVT